MAVIQGSSRSSVNAELTSKYARSLDTEDKLRYFDKLKLPCRDGPLYLSDPYGGGLSYRKSYLLLPSNLNFGNIYLYLVDSPGPYDKYDMKNYKSLEAYNNFLSGEYLLYFYLPEIFSIYWSYYVFDLIIWSIR